MSPVDEARQWSLRTLAVVAKTHPQSELTLSLPAHLCDAMAVARKLWEQFLPVAVKEFLISEVGSPASALALVEFLAGTHDVGKASDTFQASLLPQFTTRLAEHGLSPSSRPQKVPHGTLGQVALRSWLKQYGDGDGSKDLAEVIGGHHGLNPTPADAVRAMREYLPLERPAWSEVRDELLDGIAEKCDAERHLSDWVERGLSLPAQILLQGIVILADWIASDAERFPYLDDRTHAERAADALAELALGSPWSPPLEPSTDVAVLFGERFPSLDGATPNEVQVAAIELARTAAAPCLLLIEARPGLGKTEAGLLAAEALASRFGCGGLFVGLPTMATANPMFLRVADWLRTMGEQVNSINLAHGKAALNRDFADLIRRTSVRSMSMFGDGDAVRVVSWLRGRKRNLLANSVVGTIDQFLMGGLKAKHLALRHLALAGKIVLIDEVHAADDYMREYALVMLEWLGRYRTPVILMSATLPPEQRQQYIEAYAKGRGDSLPIPHAASGYPQVARYDGSLAVSAIPQGGVEQQIYIEQIPDDDERLIERLSAALAHGGCAAVIRNTVSRAQTTFAALRTQFGDDVLLLHSRFIAPHRMHRERELVAALGRDSQRPARLIVVGTQVLEQSLDVDFDLMVTDLAPIDLLLQRAGRLHRHARDNRPDAVRQPMLLVTGADWEQSPPTPVRGSVHVYGRAKLLRAAAVLQPHFAQGWLEIPADLPQLVADGYLPSLSPPPGWEAEWTTAEKQQHNRTDQARHRARDFAIAAPLDSDSMAKWLLAPAEDPESPRQLGKAQVRDGGDSVEVIVLRRDNERVLRLPDGPGPLAGHSVPEFLPVDDWRLARAMAETTISLPLSMCANPAQVDRTVSELERSLRYDSWQSSPWIAGQLALVLEPDGTVRVAGFDVAYSDELGLTATRVEGDR